MCDDLGLCNENDDETFLFFLSFPWGSGQSRPNPDLKHGFCGSDDDDDDDDSDDDDDDYNDDDDFGIL